jgi:hypothetical protein
MNMNSLFPAAKQAIAAVANATAAVSASVPSVDASGAVGGAGVSAGNKKTNRCNGCRRKLGLMPLRCRCGQDFCSEHISSSAHACTYDYKGENVKLLLEQLDMKGLSVKLETI